MDMRSIMTFPNHGNLTYKVQFKAQLSFSFQIMFHFLFPNESPFLQLEILDPFPKSCILNPKL